MDDKKDIIKKYLFYEKIKSLSFVEEIILFGSRARGDNQKRSDIDLAIFCPKATDMDWVKILDIIEEADTLLKIDCIRFDTLPLSSPLKESIKKEGLKMYAKNNP